MSSLSTAPISRIAWLGAAAALVLVVLLVYGRVLSGEFVYDDLIVIQQNPTIRSFANLPMTFGSSYWDFLDAEGASHVGYYRPLTMALLTAGYVLGNGEPIAFHVLSLLVYAASCLAAWRFAVRLTRSETIGLAAALLFALHPLHVEAVAWISSLHDPLFATFAFLSMNAFLRWRDEGSQGRPWSCGVWFALALLSKDAAVAVLPLLVVIDWGRNHLGAIEGEARITAVRRAYLPAVVVFAGYYLLRAYVFGDILAGFDRTTTHFGVGAGRLALLRVELLGGAAKLLMWPVDLNLFRPFKPDLPAGDPSLMAGLLGSVIFLGGLGLAWWKRWRPGLAMLLIIPAALAPVLISVGSLGTFPLSDRFLFLAVIGFTLLVASLLFTYLPRWAAVAVIAAIGVGYGLRGYTQTAYWKDQETLFARAIEQNPRNPNVFWGMGRAKLKRYRWERRPEQLEEARWRYDQAMDLIAEYEQALLEGVGTDIFVTGDDSLQATLGMGWVAYYEAETSPFQDYETARAVFERAIALEHRFAPSSERGNVGLGVAWMADNEPNKAGEHLRRALEINPKAPEAHFNMGLLLARLEQWDEAAEEFRACLTLRNENLEDLAYLARALMESGQNREAYPVAKRANELFPDAPDPMVILGMLSAEGGNYVGAVNWFDRALTRGELNGAAHLQRGKALAAVGQRAPAAAALKRACNLMPTNFEAHYNLMLLVMASDTPRDAVEVFVKAYRLRPSGPLDRGLRDVAEAIPASDVATLAALAIIDADRGDTVNAERWARKALVTDPLHAPSRFILGYLLKLRKDYAAADEHLAAAAGALVDSYDAQMEYAELLLVTDREREAPPYLHRARQLLSTQQHLPAEARKNAEAKILKALEKIAELEAGGPVPPGDGE